MNRYTQLCTSVPAPAPAHVQWWQQQIAQWRPGTDQRHSVSATPRAGTPQQDLIITIEPTMLDQDKRPLPQHVWLRIDGDQHGVAQFAAQLIHDFLKTFDLPDVVTFIAVRYTAVLKTYEQGASGFFCSRNGVTEIKLGEQVQDLMYDALQQDPTLRPPPGLSTRRRKRLYWGPCDI